MAIEMYGVSPSHASGDEFQADFWQYAFLHEQIVALCYDLLDATVLYSMPYCIGAGPQDQVTCGKMADRFDAALALYEDGNTPPGETPQSRASACDVCHPMIARDPRTRAFSPFWSDGESVREWIAFLRHCGGFKVF